MKTFQFIKLVRDKIPAAIENRGKENDIGYFQVGIVLTIVNKDNKILMLKRSNRVANHPGHLGNAFR